ncbi:uncharacterized protein LOC126381355 [Pectinophora gossypiella]|uniref:uncharacterized protein LOC126381355 n=1 Tax=Pectinophora gossypiella TaxID=13191 RepID=UPI00214F031F|nr:uncharacterized protein LOC126381355 [Pectinophora gossypiella]
MKDEGILRELWMRRLPSEVQRILIAQKDLPLDKVAEIADAIANSPVGHPSVNVYAATANTSTLPDLTTLINSMEALTKKVDILFKEHQRSRSRSRSNATSRTNSTSREGTKLCWYHKKFASKATKCTSPCGWNSQENFTSN